MSLATQQAIKKEIRRVEVFYLATARSLEQKLAAIKMGQVSCIKPHTHTHMRTHTPRRERKIEGRKRERNALTQMNTHIRTHTHTPGQGGTA